MFQAPVSKLSRFALWLALLSAVGAITAGPVYQLGLLDLHAAMGVLTAAVAGGALSVVAGALAVRATLGLHGKRGRGRAVLAIAVGVVVVAVPSPYFVASVTAPTIHDVTTDTDNPPAFDALAKGRDAAPNAVEYPGERAAAKQAAAYPEVAPRIYQGAGRERVFAAVESAAAELGWRVAAADSAAGLLEATHRTPWFGFIDDIVVRVAETGEGVRVDIRSASRVGESDLGANAGRIGAFFEELDRRLGAGGRY